MLGTRSGFRASNLLRAQASAGFTGPVGTFLPDGNYGIIPFGNDSYFITAGKSSYNSLQVNYRHTSNRLKSCSVTRTPRLWTMPRAMANRFNPINPELSRGLSAFDTRHNFVVSYTYVLPIDRLHGPKRLTNGWSISGITTFATGLPVTLVETDDHSLLGTSFGGPIIQSVDTPDQVGPLHILDPRKTSNHLYFDTTAFAPSAIGSEGDAKRRFFSGPGINNWNVAFHKDTPITERVNLQFKADFFNLFNHAQFATPLGLCGGVSNCSQAGSFGQVTATSELSRTAQLSLKLNF